MKKILMTLFALALMCMCMPSCNNQPKDVETETMEYTDEIADSIAIAETADEDSLKSVEDTNEVITEPNAE